MINFVNNIHGIKACKVKDMQHGQVFEFQDEFHQLLGFVEAYGYETLNLNTCRFNYFDGEKIGKLVNATITVNEYAKEE